MTLRTRALIPPPHVLVHMVKVPHSDTVQSTGQAPSKHVRVAEVAGQFSWPSRRLIVTERVRDCVPTPHFAEHGLQSDHGVIVHTRLQSHSLHCSASWKTSQGTPPWAGQVSTGRLRMRKPPPQVLVQVPNAPHAPSLQSTGQFLMPHLTFSVRFGHLNPPLWACEITLRERTFQPLPQVLVHGADAGAADAKLDRGGGWAGFAALDTCLDDGARLAGRAMAARDGTAAPRRPRRHLAVEIAGPLVARLGLLGL